jgi:hemolysin activation/secretion protein
LAAIGAVAIWAAATGEAAAQAVPPSVEPGRLPQQFQTPVIPRAVPETVIPRPRESSAPAGAERVRMTLERVTVEGSTVYPEALFQEMAAPLFGHEISLADLFRLADAISTRYRADGYVLSRAVVPAQRIGNAARIVVVEGYIAKVELDGADNAKVRAYVEQLLRSRPLRASDLERYLLLANDLPGVSARGVLAPSPDAPGGSDLTVFVEEKPFDATLGVDNRGTKFIGPAQFYLGAAANDRLGEAERIAARYITTSTQTELRYGEITVELPLGAEGTRLSLLGSVSRSKPGFTLRQFDTRSDGGSALARLSHPLLRSRTENLSLNTSFTYRDSSTVLNHAPATPPSSDDHLRVLRVGGAYDLTDRFDGVNFLAGEVNQGLPFFGAGANESATASRLGGRTEFQKATIDASRLQSLRFLASGLTLLTAVSAQHSFGDALLASEQFGVGGANFGRGYDPSEITGDNGWAFKLELQYGQVPSLSWLRDVQLYGFFDRGAVSNVRNDSTIRDPRLASAGFGTRFTLTENYLGSLEVAKPLTRVVETFRDSGDQHPWRVFFTLFAKF